MIDFFTNWMLSLVGLLANLGVMAGGAMWMPNSPEKGKAILGRVAIGGCLAVAGIVLLNAYAHALAAGNPLAIGGLLAVSLTAYVVRLAKRRAGDGMTNNRRRLPGS